MQFAQSDEKNAHDVSFRVMERQAMDANGNDPEDQIIE